MSQAAQIFPQPEYAYVNFPNQNSTEFKLVRKFLPYCKTIVPTWINPQSAYDSFMAHLPDLQEVYESLIDEESKKTFCGFWLNRVSFRLDKIVFANTPQYICHGFLPKEGDIVIDCGTNDGGTALRFLNMGCKVYGFELDEKICAQAAKLAEGKNFVVENCGLGAHKSEMKYSSFGKGGGHLNSQGLETAQITTLGSVDNLF